MTIKNTTYKNWMTVGLVAGVLALSACSKDETPMETQADTSVDAQTSVEENATATASSSDDIAVASADDGMAVSTGG
ncbi:hypothetical protein PKHYL_05240 [Psychrobacter sp. KH172YL61]|uniref:hypothetical protein n=1 Tax=Psychrobacter sp. KH172YL61 TaxID=2517899 RepID=UPI0010B48416|nr:hypothetical protein [Psychrobacter sp. KH172YL61]BBI66333.1 hypothetical protein PKHYL_05240 [Psychrobacter sp. KH172YL61]